MAQRYKFSIESKSFPLDISGEPFFLYFVLLMVYSGVFYLLGFDITGESSDWHIILYFLVLNIVTTPTTNLIMAQWNKRKQ